LQRLDGEGMPSEANRARLRTRRDEPDSKSCRRWPSPRSTTVTDMPTKTRRSWKRWRPKSCR
jgi:hypothetical protein